jgi:hypothetical protein
MLQIIPKGKALAILSALVVVGMWSNAIAAVFCPHMMGSSDRCLMQASHPHAHGSVSNAQTSMEHMDHTQMSDMDMQDMSMNMPDMRRDEATSNDSVKNEALQVAAEPQPNSEAITQPNEPCSHCMMHSRSGASYPLKSVVQNSSSNQIVAVESGARTDNNVPSCLTLVELHDHSPPGSNAARYVLNSAFRI